MSKKGPRPAKSWKAAAEAELGNLPGDRAGERQFAPPTAARRSASPRGRRVSSVPDMTPEEVRRRGDAADALFFRKIQRKDRPAILGDMITGDDDVMAAPLSCLVNAVS